MFGIGTVRCLGCGQRVKLTRRAEAGTTEQVCARCLTPHGMTLLRPVAAGGPQQLVHIYTVYSTGGRVNETFAKEAQALARVGWGVMNQAASGKVYASFRWQPATLTVTYQRLPTV